LKRRKEINRAIEDARNSLPWEMKGICTPTTGDIQARKAAARALEDVRPDASYDEMSALAREAVKTVIAAFESQKAAQADEEMRQTVIRDARLPRELSEEGREQAIKAIRQAFSQVPQGAPRRKLEQICDNLLAPVRDTIWAQQQAEAWQRQERSRRDFLKRSTSGFPWDMPSADGEKALAAVRVAIDGIPEGATESALMHCRERAIQPFLETHARRKRTEPMIAAGLREILPFVQRLEADWEFDKSAHALEAELKPAIRKHLDAELSGSETAEDVGKKVRRLVRQELDIR
jgi:DNA primase